MTSAERQIPNCAGPVFASRPATFTPPLLACDCHAHVFGPLDQFPMVPDRLYTPPEASLADYTHLLDTLGFQRGVIVQPSVYGTDNRATLEATASDPDKFRAVVVVDGSIALDQLQSYHQQGARGVRCNLLFSGDKAMQDVRRIAAKSRLWTGICKCCWMSRPSPMCIMSFPTCPCRRCLTTWGISPPIRASMIRGSGIC